MINPYLRKDISSLNIIKIILCFILVVYFSFLYFIITKIPIKDIYIEVDRIDSLYKKSETDSMLTLANRTYIDLNFHLSDLYSDSSHDVSLISFPDIRIKRQNNDDLAKLAILFDWVRHYAGSDLADSGLYSSDDMNAFYEMIMQEITDKNYDTIISDFELFNREDDSNYIDNLINIYKSISIMHENEISNPLFYYKIFTTVDGFSFNPTAKNKNFVRKNEGIYEFRYETNKNKKKISCSEYFGQIYLYDSRDNFFDQPSKWDVCDISQSYYRVHVLTHRVNRVDLDIHFDGNVRFSFLEDKPETMSEQLLSFKYQNNDIKNGIDKEILFYAQSTDLEIVQKKREFIVTAILSALIAYFISLIINAYSKIYGILYSVNKKNTNKKTKTKHRKYKSRNR